MSIHPDLTAHVRRLLLKRLPDGVAVSDITEKKMFGGLAFMVRGKHVQQPRCFVMGQLTQPLHIQPLGDTDIFAVRFEPHGFAAFCVVAAQALRHRAVPLQALFERAGWALGRRVLRASTSAQRMPIKFRHSASVFQSCTQRATRPES